MQRSTRRNTEFSLPPSRLLPSKVWSKKEDQHLQELVFVHGQKNWEGICEHMLVQFPDFPWSSELCKERWNTTLRQISSKTAWTEAEEALLIQAHIKFQNNWSQISAALKGRSNNVAKNRFYSIFRKVKNKIKKGDMVYDTELGLLQTYYVLELIMEYIAKPLPDSELHRKRGKDFIYTLIRDINSTMVCEYRANLMRIHPITDGIRLKLQGCLKYENKREEIKDNKQKRSFMYTLPIPNNFDKKTRIEEEDKVVFKAWVFGGSSLLLPFSATPTIASPQIIMCPNKAGMQAEKVFSDPMKILRCQI